VEQDEDRIICDHEVYSHSGALIQSLIIKFSGCSHLLERNPGSGYSGILTVQEGAVVFAYIEYARFSVFKWENGKYLERQRELLKSIGKTKHYCVRNLKRNKFTKWQFFGMIARDLVRVQLDLNNLERNPRHIYPKHILFRGEYEIMDYTLID
jgi:hypothetical protein